MWQDVEGNLDIVRVWSSRPSNEIEKDGLMEQMLLQASFSPDSFFFSFFR